MNGRGRGRGGGALRPVVFLLTAALLGAGWILLRDPGRPERGPVSVPNPQAALPAESLTGSVRVVIARDAPEHLVLDTIPPSRPVRLLWLDGRPVHPLADGGVVTLDAAGGVVRFDANLAVRRVALAAAGREFAGLAPAADGGLWLTDGAGGLLRADPAGRLIALGRDSAGVLVAAVASPYQRVELAADPVAGTVWLARSPDEMVYGFYPGGPAPLLVRIDDSGRPRDSLGTAVVPAHALLTDLANAGRLAVLGDTIYWAPLVRDEVVALTADGDTVWIARRGLPHGRREPRLTLVDRKPVVSYASVNLGLAIGSDDRLYLLGTATDSTASGRIDVLDRHSGRLLRSAALTSPTPTIAADADGRVYLLDVTRLLTGVANAERIGLADFELERLDGGRLRSADLNGKVTLINFWASWCGPCRAEMPALDSLSRGVGDSGFLFLTINEDLRPVDARRFMDALGLEFPVLLGGGRMKQRYHYIGLPYTVLVDRRGRVVQRWTGYAGEEQLASIRGLIRRELDQP